MTELKPEHLLNKWYVDKRVYNTNEAIMILYVESIGDWLLNEDEVGVIGQAMLIEKDILTVSNSNTPFSRFQEGYWHEIEPHAVFYNIQEFYKNKQVRFKYYDYLQY